MNRCPSPTSKSTSGPLSSLPSKSILISMLFAVVSSPLAFATSDAQANAQSGDDYSRAETLVRAHRWDEGLAILNGLVRSDPHNLRVLNLTGLAYTGKGDLKEADSYLERALQLEPDFQPSLKNLGINEFNLRDLPAAEKHLELAWKHAPADPVLNVYLGEIAYSQHNFKRSAELLPRAGALLTQDPNLQAHLGVSLLHTGQNESAFAELDQLQAGGFGRLTVSSQFALGLALAQADAPERAIPLLELVRQSEPESYDAAFNLAIAYIGAKKYPEAIAAISQLVDRGHETEELNNVLAEAYEGNHETQKAIDSLRRAIAMDPKDEDNYLDFATICINHRAFDDGLKVLAVGLSASPKSERLIFERGILYAMEDRFELAEADFQESSKLAPQSDFGYVGLGVTYLETGNAAQAIELLHTRLKQKPNDASLLYLLGEALMRSGVKPGDMGYGEAQSSLEKSVRLNADLCLPHVTLGEIYLEENRYADAVAQLEKARSVDPKEKSAYSHLAIAYRKMGNTDEAKRILMNLRDLNNEEREGMRDKMKMIDDASSPAPTTQANPLP